MWVMFPAKVHILVCEKMYVERTQQQYRKASVY